jgi:hypothetical protein
MVAGLWNPAAAALPGDARMAFGIAGLTTDQNQGVQLDMFSVSYKVRSMITTSLSFAQASVADLVRTTTDPTSIGGEIPYATSVLSLGAAGTRGNFTFGAALRYRSATLDDDHAGVATFDVGAIVDHVAGTPLRLAASTFLLSPSRSREAATYLFAADVPVYTRDSTLAVRGGYSADATDHRGNNNYGFATMNWRVFDVSAGVNRSNAFGGSVQRFRAGVGLHHAGYSVSVGREDGAAGFGASYQFVITRTVR